MKILAGASCRQSAEVLRAHLAAMRQQEVEADVDLCYVNDLDIDADDYREARDVLYDTPDIEILSTVIEQRPSDALYRVHEQTHAWNVATFEWLAFQKQRILDHALNEGYDAVWLVDTDLLPDSRTLESMLDCRELVVSGVFWTPWQTGAPPLPQVWLNHPYELSGRGMSEHEFLSRLAARRKVRVWGLGACTLIRREVLPILRYHPRLEGLPSGGMWQGEDRSFCVRAERAHIPLFADAWPNIHHIYRPSDREQIGSVPKERVEEIAEIGSMVSISLEPLSEPELAGHVQHVRGRLGALDVQPEIEDALEGMERRDEKIVTVNFPPWYPLDAYRGKKKIMRLRLLDVRPYEPHPGLAQCTPIPTSKSSSPPALSLV